MAGPIHAHATRRPVRRRRAKTRRGQVEGDASVALADVSAGDGGTRVRAAQALQGRFGNTAVQRLVEDQARPRAPVSQHQEVLAKLRAVEQALAPAAHVPTRAAPTEDAGDSTRQGFLDDAETAVLDTVADAQQTFATAQQTVPGFQQAVDVVEGIAGSSAGMLPQVSQGFVAAGEQLGGEAAAALGLTDEQDVVGDPADQPKSIADRIEDQVSDVVKQAEGAASQFKEDNPGLFQTLDDVARDLGRPLELDPDELDAAGEKLEGMLSGISSGLQNAFGIDDPTELSGGGGAGKTNFQVKNASDVHNEATLNEVATALSNQTEAGSVVSAVGAAQNVKTNGAGKVTGFDVDVTETVTLPTWSKADKQCQPIKDEWDRFSTAIAAHENKHLAIDRTNLADLAAKCIGVDESKLDDKIQAIRDKADKENDDFDTKSGHGTKEGTNIDAGIRCSDKI